MPGIKISGITNTEDARWAAILGVEFISVSLSEGDPVKVSPDMAAQISGMLPSYTAVVLEVPGPENAGRRLLEKISPKYIEYPVPDEPPQIPERFTDVRKLVPAAGVSVERTPEDGFYQVRVPEEYSEGFMGEIKENFESDKLILSGNMELPRIKKICGVLQPYAWSLGSEINRSPRKIDYGKMKEYIREISLW